VTVQHGANRGFTLVEVMFATLLLTVVGAAIATFLGTMASGSEARRSISDPALESALALRRFRSVAPEFRCVLRVTPDAAIVWLSDFVPSRSTHTSEAGVLRFDETERVLLLETIDTAFLDRNRQLEREYLVDQYTQLTNQLDSLRSSGALTASVIAEGIDSVDFSPEPGRPDSMRLTFTVDDYSTTVLLSPAQPEEPIG